MFVFLLLFLLRPADGNTTLSCIDDQGNEVDWFYIYKLPHPHEEPPEEGLKYLLLEEHSEDGWMEGGGLVGDTTGALGRSLGPLYEEGELGYILYNDQPPEQRGIAGDVNGHGGHTKGVVLFNSKQGFWLVHSTPHFPPPKAVGKFSYPSTGINNGQNFICVTYPVERFNTIGEQLKINQPHIYDCDVPESLAASAPSMHQLCKHRWENSSVSDASFSEANRSVSLLSLAGNEFVSFAKGASFNNDLYHSWVAPALQTDLAVQFWRRSTGVLPSDCSPSWKVLNVQLISPGGRVTYKATEDHSKWAASLGGGGAKGGAWVCVGDINRNEAEEKRGGGTVCRRDQAVWKAYRAAALQCDSCTGQVDECGNARTYH